MRLSRLLFLTLFVASVSSDAFALGCGWRCSRSYSGDSAECATARYFGQSNCRVVASCQIVVIDSDGPLGPAAPTLGWQCSYDCAFDPCVWV